MLILTIDTCTDTSTLGLVREGAVLAESAFPSRHTLAARLFSRIDLLLQEGGATKARVEAIAVSLGPGSFTGVRIGVTAAKVLAAGLHVPLVGVPTLEALAYPFREVPETLLAPVVNARRQQAYLALFRGREGRLTRLTPDLLLFAEGVHAVLAEHRGDARATLLIGQIAELPAEFREGLPGVRSLVTPHALAALGLARLQQGEADDPMTLAPIYLRGAADR